MPRPLTWTAYVAAALALVDGGYMIADAIHRFALGDFIRIGGELGPWAAVVSTVGIDPLAMGPVFLAVGLVQITAAGLLLLHHRWGYVLILAMAVATLWYLVFGTLSSLVQIAMVWHVRRDLRSHR
jgi:hypothetical protein